MRPHWLAAAVVVTATAVWAQLALIPLVLSPARDGAGGALSVLADALALAVAVAGVALSRERPRLGVALVLAGFPIALGAFAALAGQRGFARFDAPARAVAAATAVGFVGAAIAWARGLTAPFPVTVTAIEAPPPASRAPALRRAAPLALAAVAVFVAIIAPALVSARVALTRAERLGGEELVRGREAITAAGGLAIATWLVLGAGSRLVRGRSTPRRRTTRALAFLVWGVALYGLKLLLDNAGRLR